MNAVTFVVRGEAIPQGSTRAFTNRKTGRPIITNDNKRTKPWRNTIAEEARDSIGDLGVLQGAVRLRIDITRARPKGHYGKRGLLPSAPRWPTTKPDIDKLERAILDALTGIVYRDDAQVVSLHTTTVYQDDPTFEPCTRITILPLDYEWEIKEEVPT